MSRQSDTIPAGPLGLRNTRSPAHEPDKLQHRTWRMKPGAALILALVVQLAIVTKSVVYPLTTKIWEVRRLPALDRSAEIAFGPKFASYMTFLREVIPPEGRVVVPPMDQEPVFGNIGMMQYFLFPRDVVNCPSGPSLSACVSSMRGAMTYILAIGGFPSPEDVPEGKVLLHHSANRGLYAPLK